MTFHHNVCCDSDPCVAPEARCQTWNFEDEGETFKDAVDCLLSAGWTFDKDGAKCPACSSQRGLGG
jgi:hypothetical protein